MSHRNMLRLRYTLMTIILIVFVAGNIYLQFCPPPPPAAMYSAAGYNYMESE